MPKLTIEGMYVFIQKIMPNSVFKALKKTYFYKSGRALVHRYVPSSYSPSWHEVSNGPLKGIKIFIDSKDEWQKGMISGDYDSFFFKYLEKIDLTDKTIYDIGAHIGYSSLYFAKRVGKNGKVYAFEPNPFNTTRLEKNISANESLKNQISLISFAISDKNGEEDFVFSDNVENGTSSGSFIESAHTHMEKSIYEEKTGFKRIKVKTITLDSLLSSKDLPVPYLLKIDIEGAEGSALNGMINILQKHSPIILMEIHSIFNMFTVGETLRNVGYDITLLKEEKDGRCFIAAKKI